jgi:hypothetical protein
VEHDRVIEPAQADPIPSFAFKERRACQGWRCTKIATWNRWGGFYCYDHAIRAGWLPGPVIRPGDQIPLRAP